jgi:hypothetical protein
VQPRKAALSEFTPILQDQGGDPRNHLYDVRTPRTGLLAARHRLEDIARPSTR